jgi:hypothetical protein
MGHARMWLVSNSRKRNLKQVHGLTLLAAVVVMGIMVFPALRVCADDSTARFGAGGIEFLKSEDIRMLEEVLEISTKAVRVRFRFLNESDRDISTTVAFPLPPYPPFFTHGLSGVSNPSFLMTTFKAWVNGRPVPTESDCKAVIDGIDITTQLRELGLSDEQIFEAVDLREDQVAAAEKLGGGKKSGLLYWKVAETQFWKQRFPVGKEVVIEHTYQPAVGSSYYFGPSRTENDKHGVCLDDITRQAIEKQIAARTAKSDDGVVGDVQDVE